MYVQHTLLYNIYKLHSALFPQFYSAVGAAALPPTPIQFRLNTIQHLKNILSGFTDSPSPTLMQYFQVSFFYEWFQLHL